MSPAFFMGSLVHVGRIGLDVPWSPRWAAAATWAVIGMAVVAGAIVVGVLLFLRPGGRSARGFAEPDEDALSQAVEFPMDWPPTSERQRPRSGGAREGAYAVPDVTPAYEPSATVGAPETPEAPEAPDGF